MANVTRKEMESRIARFADMIPRPKPGSGLVSDEVLDFTTADANYSYLAPVLEGQSFIQRHAELIGGDAGDAISISLAVCSPGRGPTLHTHLNTVEAFFCLSGKFAVQWGDTGEEAIELGPWDFIHVPKSTFRTFVNVGESTGALLVIIQGPRDQFDDVVNAARVAEQLTTRFGPSVLTALVASGRRFAEQVEL